MIADALAGVALAAACYEAVAVWTERVPTITDLVVKTPKLVRIGGLAAAAVWGLYHFMVF